MKSAQKLRNLTDKCHYDCVLCRKQQVNIMLVFCLTTISIQCMLVAEPFRGVWEAILERQLPDLLKPGLGVVGGGGRENVSC